MNQKPEEVEIKSCPELLLCPFCGGRPEIFNIENDIDYPRDFGGSVIECKDCHASTKVFFGEKIGLNDAWNHRTPTPRNEDGRKFRVLDEKKVISIALFVLLNHTYLSKVSNKECVDLSLKIGKEIILRLGNSPIPTIEDIYNTIGLTYLKGCSEDGSYLNDTHVQLNYKDKFRLAQAIHSLLKGEA